MEGSGSTQLTATLHPPSRNCCSPISIWQLPSAVGVGVAVLSLLASGWRWPSNNVYNLFIRLLRTTTQKHREQQLAVGVRVRVKVERGTGQRTGAHKKLRQRQCGVQVHVLSYMYRYTGSYIYTFIYVCGRLWTVEGRGANSVVRRAG